jgi:tetratricopeptide (TPR) repeat protein
MWRSLRIITILVCFSPFLVGAQAPHQHSAPEKLGKVSFPISCQPAVQQEFNRGVALLHSFAYANAETAFRSVSRRDPKCAMAHWGIAMSHFHQLWEPPISPTTIPGDQKEIQLAKQIGTGSDRERKFINALGLLYEDAASVPYCTRALDYERAMSILALENRDDIESQVFYALALLSTALPTDTTHANQRKAAAILEPLYRANPDHPGIPHYLIHAYDNAELAAKGLPYARAYSKIAPSAPHALHMPSHIFTRLGLWDDSIASNIAARAAAHEQGDTGEELHAMDYLVYAYLQLGRDADAVQVIKQLNVMSALNTREFKIGYASTAMPVRYAVERGQWADAANIPVPIGAPPQVEAIAVWARGLGLARGGRPSEARPQIEKLNQLAARLRTMGNDYWATQVEIESREVSAWVAQAEGKPEEAAAAMRRAAEDEDAVEKLPVTPGPIIPAREQLGYLLLEQKKPDGALREFQSSLRNSPGRRGSLQGISQASAQRFDSN